MRSLWAGFASIAALVMVVACSSSSNGSGSGGAAGSTGGGAGTGGSHTGGTGGGTGGSGVGGTGGSATGGGGTGGSETDAGNTGGGGTGGGGTGGTGGCSTPGTLHPPNADAGTATLYCPFSGVDGGTNAYCDTTTEHCCEPKSGTAACTPTGVACATGDTDWQCEDPSECGSGQKCCGKGTFVASTDPSCANYATGFTGTYCAASCQATEIVMCTSNAECTSGKTCVPFKSKGNQVGACQ